MTSNRLRILSVHLIHTESISRQTGYYTITVALRVSYVANLERAHKN